MHLEAKGLRGNNPCDMLAALGLLRAWDCQWPEHRAKLAFDPEGLFAVLEVPEIPAGWAETLLEGIRGIAPRLVHGDIIKCPQTLFRQKTLAAVEAWHEPLDGWGKLPAAMYAAYGTELDVDKDGEVTPTQLSFANNNGGQLLLSFFVDLVEYVDENSLRKCLDGDSDAWEFSTGKARAFRWCPSEYRRHAMMDADPGDGKNKKRTRPSVNLLAFIGLSFFPVAHEQKETITTGVSLRKKDGKYFQWPLWEMPAGVDEVQSLLGNPNAVGVFSRYESRRDVPDKKNTYFLPASICS